MTLKLIEVLDDLIEKLRFSYILFGVLYQTSLILYSHIGILSFLFWQCSMAVILKYVNINTIL